jgi:hypothetical protein
MILTLSGLHTIIIQKVEPLPAYHIFIIIDLS